MPDRTRNGHQQNLLELVLSASKTEQENARAALRRALNDNRASVTLFTTLMMLPTIGVLGLAFDASHWAAVKIDVQSKADVSAYAGAMFVNRNPGRNADAVNQAQNLGTLNGVHVSALIVPGVLVPSHIAVQATATTTVPIAFAQIFIRQSSIDISATSIVEVIPPPPNAPQGTPGTVQLVQ